MKFTAGSLVTRLILISPLVLFAINQAPAQDKRVIRIARIKIDSTQLDGYKTAVKEQIQTAMRVERGVLMLYAVYDQKIPTNVTVFEIYADNAAYQSHIQTSHFKKYKTETANMVKSLELIDVNAIELGQKKQ